MEQCTHPLMIDRVDSEGRYVYMCVNPKCKNYRKAVYLNGETTEATIKSKDKTEKE